MKTNILPFSGFYESRWSSAVDDAELSLAQYLTGDPESDCGEGEDGFRGRAVSDVCSALYRVVGYNALHKAIAKEYTECLIFEIDRACGWDTKIKFESLDSPREYNFVTDRIFATLPRSTVRRMRKECDAAILARVAAERHTSRDGFVSFYSPYASAWGPLDKWDHNQVTTLFVAWSETLDHGVSESDIHEAMYVNGFFGEALERCFVWDELRQILDKSET